MIRLLLLLVTLGVAAAGWYGWNDYHRYLTDPLDLPEAGETFTIEKGWSAGRVAVELEQQGVIDKRYWFDLFVRLSEKAGGIKTGEYRLMAPMTVPDLLDTFHGGQTTQYTQSVIEGYNWRQTLAHVAASSDLQHTLSAEQLSSPESLMALLGFPGLHPEGQFYADTYAFPRGTTDVEFLQRAKSTMDRVLAEEWADRQPDLPLETPYEALILASIVEKETALVSERPLIAGVFVSRLRKNMRLQTDPTVIYGIGESFDGDIRRKDLTTDTPYNTYTRAGLPPSPIAMVGREAIHAVMHPEDTTALYFVARGDGSHQFSETLSEHNAAVRKYQLKR
ncbi:endolytic transglycosylase MltG [Granulosicoccus sp. 3-233]|uniref:endolytic transglycosylase MltG n=1 Tax=Granulosicoccus sp. 3-233 TaxID=3417969 RepID=UPI003D345D08